MWHHQRNRRLPVHLPLVVMERTCHQHCSQNLYQRQCRQHHPAHWPDSHATLASKKWHKAGWCPGCHRWIPRHRSHTTRSSIKRAMMTGSCRKQSPKTPLISVCNEHTQTDTHTHISISTLAAMHATPTSFIRFQSHHFKKMTFFLFSFLFHCQKNSSFLVCKFCSFFDISSLSLTFSLQHDSMPFLIYDTFLNI